MPDFSLIIYFILNMFSEIKEILLWKRNPAWKYNIKYLRSQETVFSVSAIIVIGMLEFFTILRISR